MTEAGEQTTAQRRTWRKSADKPKFERERILSHQAHAPINIDEVAKIRISQEKKKRRKSQQKQHSEPGVKVGFADLARTIASKWKHLDDEVKAAFEKHAEQEKIRYKQQLEQWAQAKSKEEPEDDTAAAAAQMDDSSLLLGTVLPLQMEDETTAPQPVSPFMFESKPEVEIPRTIAFKKKENKRQSEQSSAQDNRQGDTRQRRMRLGEVNRPDAFPSEVDVNGSGDLQQQMSDTPDANRHLVVTPPQDHVVSSPHPNEEQEMRKLLQHCTSLLTAKLYELETSRNSVPTMPHNLRGRAPCCASCMANTASSDSGMFQQGPQMSNMGQGINAGNASLRFMQGNNGMMRSAAAFKSVGPIPGAAGFAWNPIAMQSVSVPAANSYEFPTDSYTTNGQANSEVWTGNSLDQPKGMNFSTPGSWEPLTAEGGSRRVSM